MRGPLVKGYRRDYVLSAGHCVDPSFPGGFKVSHVIVGEHDQTNPYDGQQFMAVMNVELHPAWIDGNDNYDLAIIKHCKQPYNPGARAIDLPWIYDNFSKYAVDGWG